MIANFRGILELIFAHPWHFFPAAESQGHFPTNSCPRTIPSILPSRQSFLSSCHPSALFAILGLCVDICPSCFLANSTAAAAYITLRFVKQTIKICKKKPVKSKCAGVLMLEQILFFCLPVVLFFCEKCSTVAELRAEFRSQQW